LVLGVELKGAELLGGTDLSGVELVGNAELGGAQKVTLHGARRRLAEGRVWGAMMTQRKGGGSGSGARRTGACTDTRGLLLL
jgi:hypothetical protein